MPRHCPGDIKRIAFLDSNYGYETTNHFAKLLNWLRQTDVLLSTNLVAADVSPLHLKSEEVRADSHRLLPSNYLCALAYHDSIALRDGKTS